MGEKLEILKGIKENITDLENLKSKYKEQNSVMEYIRNKYVLDYFNEIVGTEDILSNEDYLKSITTIDRLTRIDEVKKYISVCENLKLCKNLKGMLLTEYASKQKTKK